MVKSAEALEQDYREVTAASRAQWERGRPVMPGGVIKGAYWSPPYPLYFDRAKDCNLWDLDGNRYLDFANHHTAMVLGHSYPAVVEAVQKEVERGFGLGGPTTLEAEIAEEIVGRVPSVEKVRYTNSGTEATLQATRIVRAVSGKPKIAKFEGAFHGAHDALEYSVGAVADPTQAGPADAPVPVPSHLGMTAGADDQVVVLPYNDPETVELILREHQDELAAVIYDGKPAALEVPYEFSQFIRDVTRELGIYLVADEYSRLHGGPRRVPGGGRYRTRSDLLWEDLRRRVSSGRPWGQERADGRPRQLGASHGDIAVGHLRGQQLHSGRGAGDAPVADSGGVRAPGCPSGAAARRYAGCIRRGRYPVSGDKRRVDSECVPYGKARPERA